MPPYDVRLSTRVVHVFFLIKRMFQLPKLFCSLLNFRANFLLNFFHHLVRGKEYPLSIDFKAMTSYINFTALSGAGKEGFLCYLLEIDEARILLDCGWTEEFNVEELSALKSHATNVDAVLLSHSSVEHVGGLAMAVRHFGMTCPVYATYPVQNMGQLAVADAYCAFVAGRPPPPFDLKDVENAFDAIKTLRYRQKESLSGNALGINITAHNAGHSLGGTIWKIVKDTEEIVYAVDYNHKKERHLSSAALMTSDVLNRPTILITSSRTADDLSLITKRRDEKLTGTVVEALRAGGSVLIPVDVTSRALEVGRVLDQYWSSNALPYPITIVSPVAKRTFRLAKSMLEYMNDALASMFSHSKDNPVQFRHVKLASSLDELSEGPQVILASSSSLNCGPSRGLFNQWCAVSSNVLLLVQKGEQNSLSRSLHDQWMSSFDGSDEDVTGALVHLNVILTLVQYEKHVLEGEELLEFMATRTGGKGGNIPENTPSQIADAVDVDGVLEADTSDDEGDVAGQAGQVGDDEHAGRWFARQPDLYVKNQCRLTGGFFRGTQSYRMYPVPDVLLQPMRKTYDDFGEAIDPQEYSRGEFYLEEQENAGGIVNNYRSDEVKRHHKPDLSKLETLDSLIEKPDAAFHLSELNMLTNSEDGVPVDAANETGGKAFFKYSSESADFAVQCSVTFINMEGLADGQSVKNVLSQLSPKKIIFVRGTVQQTDTLAEFVRKQTVFTSDVLCPSLNQRYNVSSAASIWQVKITDGCFRSLAFEKANNVSIAPFSGTLVIGDGGAANERQQGMPHLELAPVGRRRVPPSVLIGQVSLNTVKLALSRMKEIAVDYGKIKLTGLGYETILRSAYTAAESQEHNVKDETFNHNGDASTAAKTVTYLRCYKRGNSRALVCIIYKFPRDKNRSDWIFQGSLLSKEAQSVKQVLTGLHVQL